MGLISSLLSKIKPNKDLKEGTAVSWGSLFSPTFSESYDAKLNDVYMSCAQAHANYVSKFTPRVYRHDDPTDDPSKKYLNTLLSLRPNPVMNASAFWERVAKLYFLENNVFIFMEWDFKNYNEPLKALWILDPVDNAVEIRVTDKGETVVNFSLNGEQVYTGLENIIHIARNVGANILGEGNRAIKRVLDVISTNYEGIEQAVKTSAFIRFIVQSGTLLSEQVRKERAKDFADSYLGKGSSGVVYLDAASNIVQVKPENKYANEAEMKLFENKIYNYMGISESILQAKANEDERQAYFEMSITPLINKIEQEITYKVFTKKELSYGNRIVITPDKLESTSLKTKIEIAKVIQKLPVYVPNHINALLGMPLTEEGEKEYSTLNFVEADKQNTYQGLNNENNPEEEQPEEGEELNE